MFDRLVKFLLLLAVKTAHLLRLVFYPNPLLWMVHGNSFKRTLNSFYVSRFYGI